MQIITSHNALDFDGLAAMIAAGKLYPSAVPVFSGTLSNRVKQFMALYKDLLMIKVPKEINLNEITGMIIVDTAAASRLGHLKGLVEKVGLDFHIYDHHPVMDGDIRGSINEIHPVGAATTILVEKIIERKLTPNAFEATIMALGIYEDTGSLLFTSTTQRDVSAAAYLLGLGANLQIVANFMEQPFSGEQRQLLQNLLQTSRHYRIKNVDVVIAVAQSEEFISGLDVVTYQLMEVENCDVVFTVASMQGKIHVVGRSRTGNVKVNEILKELGGRGHEKAAAAIIRGKETGKVVDLINGLLGELVQPALLARDIMSTPVKTIPMQTSIEDAGRIMLRYGHTGMPVIDQGKMVGVISRRDVDKAKLHNLGHAPVKGFMTTAVMSVAPDATVSEIHRIMVEYDIGRLPIIENNRLVGIVSRTDIIRTLHGEDYPDDYQVLYLNSETGAENCLELIHQQLPSQILNVLTVIGQVAEGLGAKAYCVGGFVRDLLLRREQSYDCIDD